jgi:hypothetical protein
MTYYKVTAGELLFPTTETNYKLECCDCGLVHDMYFSVFKASKEFPDGSFTGQFLKGKKWKVAIIADRNNRATVQRRKARACG